MTSRAGNLVTSDRTGRRCRRNPGSGDLEYLAQRAQEFVNLGLEFDPKAKELGYLNLILVRQQIPR